MSAPSKAQYDLPQAPAMYSKAAWDQILLEIEQLLSQMFAGGQLFISDTKIMTTKEAFTDGAGGATGTLTNAPTSGNPTKWIPINDNGTTRFIPAW